MFMSKTKISTVFVYLQMYNERGTCCFLATYYVNTKPKFE